MKRKLSEYEELKKELKRQMKLIFASGLEEKFLKNKKESLLALGELVIL